jgi:hypothetical protein
MAVKQKTKMNSNLIFILLMKHESFIKTTVKFDYCAPPNKCKLRWSLKLAIPLIPNLI